MQHDGIAGILKSRTFPGVHGKAKGPGNGANETVFERLDMDNEYQRIGRRMEEDGKLKDPTTAAWFDAIGRDIASKPEHEKKRDYEKEGMLGD
jgi:hypothetical protein